MAQCSGRWSVFLPRPMPVMNDIWQWQDGRRDERSDEPNPSARQRSNTISCTDLPCM